MAWGYLVESWMKKATKLYMKCTDLQGQDSTYKKTYSIDFKSSGHQDHGRASG